MKKFTKRFLIANLCLIGLVSCGEDKKQEEPKTIVTEDRLDPMLLNEKLFFENKFFVETYNYMFFDSLERQRVEEMLFELKLSKGKVAQMGDGYVEFQEFKNAELAYMDYMIRMADVVADKLGFGDEKWAQAYIETMDSLDIYATQRDVAQEAFITKFHKGKEEGE